MPNQHRKGHGSAIPSPRKKGKNNPVIEPDKYNSLDKIKTAITTGATHAPANNADTAPIKKIIIILFELFLKSFC